MIVVSRFKKTSRFLNRAFRDHGEAALSYPLPKRFALMALCSILVKEEEEIVAQSDGETPRQLFGNKAVLFLQLYASSSLPDPSTMLIQWVELINLLHPQTWETWYLRLDVLF
ncbi:unnamed protein product [Peronospora farinosa]|uniref:Uncharacterized protein n=1 Tax=Peronospora farinosa TaxID=134698 RepID=A0AAV0TGT2_9STRA|nr:unnamed protein product [Peronospora farinosa]